LETVKLVGKMVKNNETNYKQKIKKDFGIFVSYRSSEKLKCI